jgi:hypothetical protein
LNGAQRLNGLNDLNGLTDYSERLNLEPPQGIERAAVVCHYRVSNMQAGFERFHLSEVEPNVIKDFA